MPQFLQVDYLSILQIGVVISDVNGGPGHINPILLILDRLLKPFRIHDQCRQALQIISPVLDDEIALRHLPSGPHLVEKALEGSTDLGVSLMLVCGCGVSNPVSFVGTDLQ
jgi:hypothetical protein